jgi:hypothetical protein
MSPDPIARTVRSVRGCLDAPLSDASAFSIHTPLCWLSFCREQRLCLYLFSTPCFRVSFLFFSFFTRSLILKKSQAPGASISELRKKLIILKLIHTPSEGTLSAKATRKSLL